MVRPREEILGEFVSWAVSTRPMRQAPGGGRAFRERTRWCWSVPVPRPAPTGEVYSQLFIDGLHVRGGWVLLVARSPSHVVSWQWAGSENAAAYTALLHDLAPPLVVTTDGAGGALKALRALWPDTPVQRCLLHVHRDTTRDLTRRPHTPAGKALLALSARLLTITTIDQAHEWGDLLEEYTTVFGPWLNERTHAAADPQRAAATGRTWWYTHERARRAHRRLIRLARHGVLFTYLTCADDAPLERTTNPVESVNARLRELTRAHRGTPPEHQARILEWALASMTENPPTPTETLAQWDTAGRPTASRIPRPQAHPHHDTTGAPPWGTTPTPQDGLHTRKGWAGRP